ncbi:hypothetical protein E1293_38170 [Actinomadura darangshiensis]|uniref:DUF8094 domain-containing protein n=1 Tax=Actinomadura darangshiensis TaxID=705336 RepID=A0A4R5A8Z0_9ACTN|nr:hypothetical protein [Actinomadura darangshiensis]TDD67329.1 hypothetical protein E1293_38170 [Actinomadura darangshiensis]
MHRFLRVVAAGVLLTLLTAAGCAEGKTEARPTVTMPETSPPEPVPLTPDVAERAFRTYVTDEDVARAAGDERLALTWTSDGQSQLTAAEFRKAAYDGDPVRRFVYGKPKLYVPKLKDGTYPQWFVVSVDRSVLGEKKSKRRALMGFILRRPSDEWKLTLATLLEEKAKEPKVAIDAAGYATALSTEDSRVLIRPRDVGGIQATIAAEGPGSVAAKVMKSSPVTTGFYQDAKKARKKAKKKDLTLQVVYTATPFPYFALRTESGGGLVIYSLFRNTTLIAKDPGTPKPEIPAEAEHLLDGTVEGNEVDTTSTLHFAAYDPPMAKKDATQPKAHMIADEGAVTKAATPPIKKP